MVRTEEPTGEEMTCPDGIIDAFAAAAGNADEQTDEDDDTETPRELAAGLGLPDPTQPPPKRPRPPHSEEQVHPHGQVTEPASASAGGAKEAAPANIPPVQRLHWVSAQPVEVNTKNAKLVASLESFDLMHAAACHQSLVNNDEGEVGFEATSFDKTTLSTWTAKQSISS